MHRLLVLVAGATMVASCAEIDCELVGDGPEAICPNDDRPATLEYVTTTILRPNCANAQCHSSFANTFDYRFDTVEHAQQSMVSPTAQLVFPGDPDASLLYLVLVRPTQEDGTAPRMPYDQPLPGSEIALIKRWIQEGADGLVVP
jgi:hypothetical protein